MDLGSLLGNISEDSVEKSIVLKKAKEMLPHIMYDKIPFEFDTSGNVSNSKTALALSQWQKEVIYNLKPNDTPIVISHLTNGSGKASRHSAKVWTPDGYKLMGDIQVGDLVLTPDGKSVKVLAKYPQGKVKIFRVSFSDGSFTDVTEDHLWEISRWKSHEIISEILPTSQIKDNLTINKGKSWRYSIPLVEDVNFSPREVSIDPYLMGLLIGDGCFRHNSAIGFTNIESDIISYVETNGFKKVPSSKYDYRRYDKGFEDLVSSYNLLGKLSNDKFVPTDYLYNTREVRLATLKGLMDTDGCITLSKPSESRKGGSRSIEFTSKSLQLCKDVKFLVLSLGGLASEPVERVTKCNGKEFTSYRTHIQVSDDLCIFNTGRKVDLFNKSTCRMRKRFITSIEQVGEDDASCISIDHPRHLYLVDDLICTHNTYLIGLSLTLLLLDDHPSLSPGFMDVRGEFWLLTNTSLLKTEYPKNFLDYPGWLGKEQEYKDKGYKDILNSRGETHRIRWVKDDKGMVVGFKNETNGKSIRFWSYAVNEQKLAGHNPLSIFCDEFGDKTTTSAASGANKLTIGKMEEMLVRCGRNNLAGNNWVFCMFFTLTLGEAWVEEMLDKVREGTWYMPRLCAERHKPDDHQFVHLIKSMKTTDANPSINKSTVAMALDFAENLGRLSFLEKRLISTDGDDPNLVFPRTCRPQKMTPEDVQNIIKLAITEPGWTFIESIDPGWADQCSVLFCLAHPIKGLYFIDEFYGSGYIVDQVATIVKNKEQSTFPNIKLDIRLYDPHHIRKTTQESPVPNYYRWRDAGLPGRAAYHSKDRSYDYMFTLIIKNLVHYYNLNCKGLDKELRVHRKDEYGIPEDKKNNHSIDAMRHICNWYYAEYAKKIHLVEPLDTPEISPEQQAYLAQLNYYNNFIKPEIDKSSKRKNSVLGVPITRLSKRNLKGF